jgi:hypothetical protein
MWDVENHVSGHNPWLKTIQVYITSALIAKHVELSKDSTYLEQIGGDAGTTANRLVEHGPQRGLSITVALSHIIPFCPRFAALSVLGITRRDGQVYTGTVAL